MTSIRRAASTSIRSCSTRPARTGQIRAPQRASPPYKGRPSHPFAALCARLGTEHRHTEELLRRKFYRTITELQADLDEHIAWYNTCRPHQGLHNRGRPPLQVIREFLRAKEEITAA